MTHYKVLDDNALLTGTAEEVLQQIIDRNKASDIGKLRPKQYAERLIQNASYFVPESVVANISLEVKGTPFDTALNLLNVIPTSGTHIMSADPTGGEA